MADLEEKIKNLLESPEGMSQIIKTAQSLFGGGEVQNTVKPGENTVKEEEESATVSQTLPVVADNGFDDNFLEKLDPKVVTTAMQVMNEYRKTDDRRIQLLHALRSYFKDEDQVHITKAIQIVKLSKVAKQAFRSLREEDSFV